MCPTSRHLEASFAGHPVHVCKRAGKWSSGPGPGPVKGECTGEAVSARAFPVVAWTLALVQFVASSCGCPWWRGKPWPLSRMKSCWLALQPRATKIQNEFLQPGLGRHARKRESSKSKGLTAISPFQIRAWGQGNKGIGPSQGTSQPSCLWGPKACP